MLIKCLKIKNFRSFNEFPSLIKFNDGINVIVGENNAGKSNILKALELITKRKEISPDDYHKGESYREILVTATLEFDENEMNEIVKQIIGIAEKNKIKQAMKELGNSVDMEFSSKSKTNHNIVRFNDFWVEGNNIYSLGDDGKGRRTQMSSISLINEYLNPNNKKTLGEIFKAFLLQNPSLGIAIQNNLSDILCKIFSDKSKNFAEIRQCPSGSNKHVFESLDGTQLADVLFNLKNGDRPKRRKWKEIQRKFTDLFPNLKLDVTKIPPKDPPKIKIEKEALNHEVPISFSGSAIGEILILLTHIIYFENMCFGIDMPELHLHPHAQRLLQNTLGEESENNQFFVVTHSPTFIDPNRIENVLVVRERDGRTVVKQLDKAPELSEKVRLKRHLDEHAREFFFSRAVLIVEGATEKGAMPIFSKIIDKDFDKYGISVLEAGSQFCRIFIKILRAFDFPYLVMNDRDAVLNISGKIKRGKKSIKTSGVFQSLEQLLTPIDSKIIEDIEALIQTIGIKRKKEVYPDELFTELKDLALKYDVYILPTDFEGILKRDGYGNLLKEASKLSGRKKSKVICGRYLAEKIAENNLNVPKEFQEIINRITKKSSTL